MGRRVFSRAEVGLLHVALEELKCEACPFYCPVDDKACRLKCFKLLRKLEALP